MRFIPLTQSNFALVDDVDYERLSKFKWYYYKSRGKEYAVRKPRKVDGKRTGFIWMHREVVKPKKGLVVDHINGYTLDNTRGNLRACTRSQNQWNKNLNVKSHTGLKNIHWSKYKQRFIVRFSKYGKKIDVGYFKSLEHAVYVRNKVAPYVHEGFNQSIQVSTSV